MVAAGTERRHPCCGVCERAWIEAGHAEGVYRMRTFIVCPTCGNKRCPNATHHTHVCTRSNDSGQNGSFYGSPWPCDEVES